MSVVTNKMLPSYSVSIALLHKSELPTPSLVLMSSAQPQVKELRKFLPDL